MTTRSPSPSERGEAPAPGEIRRVRTEAECLHDRAAVETALDRMAMEITRQLAEADPLVICVLHGGMPAMGGLLSRLDFPLQVDYLHATRYRGATRGGELHWRVRPEHSLAGRVVLVVDDILDEGLTLAALKDYCREAGAAAVHAAVLVRKELPNPPAAEADFIGLRVGDRYVFGYGMDYKDYLRNAPGIFAVKEL